MIQRWGRWSSDSVYLYILDTVFERSWRNVAPAMIGSCDGVSAEGSKAQQSDVAVFQGRLPRPGDRVSVWSKMHNKWVQGQVDLTPGCKRPPGLKDSLPMWPLGDTVYRVKFKGATGCKPHDQTISLDSTTRWIFTGEPLPKKTVVVTRRGREAVQRC